MTEISKKIIVKYLDSKASEAEIQQLSHWLQKESNQVIFKDYFKTKIFLDLKFKTFNSQEAIELLLNENKIRKPKLIYRKSIRHWMKYAAIFIGLLLVSTYILTNNIPETSIFKISGITLQIDDNDIKVVKVNGQNIITTKNGEEIGIISNTGLTLNNNSNFKKKLAFNNIITVPYGKLFDLILEDGTKIHLNAGSELNFPSYFPKNSNREVFLIGEGYFEVAKNKNAPFLVTTENLVTRVYGTEFNISAYENSNTTAIVLIEGSVGVQQNFKNSNYNKGYLILSPSQKASISKNSNDIEIENVDVKFYTAWKDRILMFDNNNITEIFKKLERNFNIEIQNNYHELNSHSFTGIFEKENLDQILTTISNHTSFSYSRIGNKIIINK